MAEALVAGGIEDRVGFAVRLNSGRFEDGSISPGRGRWTWPACASSPGRN
jgi:hypothetical protein